MESVIWAFKQLCDKGLVYEANRVMPYSWGAETPLSNFEIRLDDATRPRQDPAITVSFTLEPRRRRSGPDARPGLDHDAVDPAVQPRARGRSRDRLRDRRGATATTTSSPTPRATKYAAQLEGTRVVGTVKGAELVGRTYQPLLPYFRHVDNAFRVIGGDFVDTTEGTGIVHIAPGFGEDDQRVAEEQDIGIVVPVDESGNFTSDVVEWAGQNVLESNDAIIRHLKDLGRIVRHETYVHNYPHCWRTDTAHHLPRPSVVVRGGDRVPRPSRRAEPADPLDPRARPGRPVRQVARGRPRLVDQPQPVLGLPDTGVAKRRPRLPAHRRVRIARRAGPRLRRASRRPAPALDRRARAPEPRRPHRSVDDATRPRGAGLLVRVGFDALRAGALPVREPRLVRAPLPRRLHRRVRRPDPRLVLHAPRAGHRPVRQARVPERDLPRGRAGCRRPEALEAAAQLPRARRRLRDPRLGRHAVVPHVVADPAGPRPADRQGGVRHRRGGEGRPHPDLERVPLLHPVRERRAATAPVTAPTARSCSTATCSPRPASWWRR